MSDQRFCVSGTSARFMPNDTVTKYVAYLDWCSPCELRAGWYNGLDDIGPDFVFWQTHELSGQFNLTIDVVRALGLPQQHPLSPADRVVSVSAPTLVAS